MSAIFKGLGRDSYPGTFRVHINREIYHLDEKLTMQNSGLLEGVLSTDIISVSYQSDMSYNVTIANPAGEKNPYHPKDISNSVIYWAVLAEAKIQNEVLPLFEMGADDFVNNGNFSWAIQTGNSAFISTMETINKSHGAYRGWFRNPERFIDPNWDKDASGNIDKTQNISISGDLVYLNKINLGNLVTEEHDYTDNLLSASMPMHGLWGKRNTEQIYGIHMKLRAIDPNIDYVGNFLNIGDKVVRGPKWNEAYRIIEGNKEVLMGQWGLGTELRRYYDYQPYGYFTEGFEERNSSNDPDLDGIAHPILGQPNNPDDPATYRVWPSTSNSFHEIETATGEASNYQNGEGIYGTGDYVGLVNRNYLLTWNKTNSNTNYDDEAVTYPNTGGGIWDANTSDWKTPWEGIGTVVDIDYDERPNQWYMGTSYRIGTISVQWDTYREVSNNVVLPPQLKYTRKKFQMDNSGIVFYDTVFNELKTITVTTEKYYIQEDFFVWDKESNEPPDYTKYTVLPYNYEKGVKKGVGYVIEITYEDTMNYSFIVGSGLGNFYIHKNGEMLYGDGAGMDGQPNFHDKIKHIGWGLYDSDDEINISHQSNVYDIGKFGNNVVSYFGNNNSLYYQFRNLLHPANDNFVTTLGHIGRHPHVDSTIIYWALLHEIEDYDGTQKPVFNITVESLRSLKSIQKGWYKQSNTISPLWNIDSSGNRDVTKKRYPWILFSNDPTTSPANNAWVNWGKTFMNKKTDIMIISLPQTGIFNNWQDISAQRISIPGLMVRSAFRQGDSRYGNDLNVISFGITYEHTIATQFPDPFYICANGIPSIPDISGANQGDGIFISQILNFPFLKNDDTITLKTNVSPYLGGVDALHRRILNPRNTTGNNITYWGVLKVKFSAKWFELKANEIINKQLTGQRSPWFGGGDMAGWYNNTLNDDVVPQFGNTTDIVAWKNTTGEPWWYGNPTKGILLAIIKSTGPGFTVSLKYGFMDAVADGFIIPVQPGWNLLGTYQNAANDNRLIDANNVIVENKVYILNNNSYELVPITEIGKEGNPEWLLKEGVGYWIKCEERSWLLYD